MKVYNFGGVPQDKKIKIRKAECPSDNEALVQAKKMNKNHNYVILTDEFKKKFVMIKV